jgi:hypothetical protein
MGILFGGFGILFILDLPIKSLLFVTLNGVLHWITDYYTSKATRRYYENNEMKNFWDTIGLDQLIHIITLLLTYNLIFG